MEEAIKGFIRSMHLVAGHNTQRVFMAWDQVSNASQYTSNKFFRDGVLTITMTSSAARNRLMRQHDALVRALNDCLLKDPLFIQNDPQSRLVTRILFR